MIQFGLLALDGLELQLQLPQRGQGCQEQFEEAPRISPQVIGNVLGGVKGEGLRIFPKPPVGMAEGDLQRPETRLRVKYVPEAISFLEPTLLGEEVEVLQALDGGGEGAGSEGSVIGRTARMVFHGHVPGRRYLGGFGMDAPAGAQEGGVQVLVAVAEMRAVVVFMRRVAVFLFGVRRQGIVEDPVAHLGWESVEERALLLSEHGG